MWFPGAEQSLPVYSSQHAYFTAHIHLGFFPITQPPRYFVLDNADFPQLWDLRSNFAATAKSGICSSPDDTWGYCRVGAALSTDSCWRWPFDLVAELMQDPSLPFLQAIFVIALSASIDFPRVWPTQPLKFWLLQKQPWSSRLPALSSTPLSHFGLSGPCIF